MRLFTKVVNDQYLFKKLFLGPLQIFWLRDASGEDLFFLSSQDFSGKNSSCADVKTLCGGNGDLDLHFPKRGDCVKKVEDPLGWTMISKLKQNILADHSSFVWKMISRRFLHRRFKWCHSERSRCYFESVEEVIL